MIYLQTTSNYDMPNRNKETSLFLFHSFQFPLVVNFCFCRMRKLSKGTISFCWSVPNRLFWAWFLECFCNRFDLMLLLLACLIRFKCTLFPDAFAQSSLLISCKISLREIIVLNKNVRGCKLWAVPVAHSCWIKYVHSRVLFAFSILDLFNFDS